MVATMGLYRGGRKKVYLTQRMNELCLNKAGHTVCRPIGWQGRAVAILDLTARLTPKLPILRVKLKSPAWAAVINKTSWKSLSLVYYLKLAHI